MSTINKPARVTAFDDEPDNPALSDVVERNLRTIFMVSIARVSADASCALV